MVKARASSVKTTFFTLSSSSAKALNASSKDVPLTYRVLSGWRTLRFAAARQARPRPTHAEQRAHLGVEAFVDQALIRGGEIAQVYAFGRGGVHAAHEVLVHLLAMKGTKGAITLDSVTSTV